MSDSLRPHELQHDGPPVTSKDINIIEITFTLKLPIILLYGHFECEPLNVDHFAFNFFALNCKYKERAKEGSISRDLKSYTSI